MFLTLFKIVRVVQRPRVSDGQLQLCLRLLRIFQNYVGPCGSEDRANVQARLAAGQLEFLGYNLGITCRTFVYIFYGFVRSAHLQKVVERLLNIAFIGAAQRNEIVHQFVLLIDARFYSKLLQAIIIVISLIYNIILALKKRSAVLEPKSFSVASSLKFIQI